MLREGEGPADGLLQSAAKLGFKGMHCHHMDKMVSLLAPGLPRSQRPSTDKAYGDFFVKAALPGCTEEQLKEAYCARGKVPPCDSILSCFDDLDAIEHSLEEADTEEIKKGMKQAAARRAPRARSRGPRPGCGAGFAFARLQRAAAAACGLAAA